MAKKKRKGEFKMSNQLIEKCIGKECYVSSGSLGTAVKGEVISVVDNWLEISNKTGTRLMNIEYITTVQIIEPKIK